MMRCRAHAVLALFAAAAMLPSSPGAFAQGAAPAAPIAAAQPPGLAPHRAVYDLKLSSTRGSRPMQAVRGRILYDFTGSACEGYALQFRQVSELDSGEGNALFSDLRASTWEDGLGQRLTFRSQNYLDQKLRDSVDGEAKRVDNGIAIRLKKPADKSVDMSGQLIFPTEHIRRVLAAAREGRSVFEVSVYDGSESGEKTYDTLTVIGKKIEPDEKKPQDAAGASAALAGLARWPVTISYFDKGKAGGEQMPVYSINFELYENGISRALMLDYNEFVLSGEMTSIEVKDAKPCP